MIAAKEAVRLAEEVLGTPYGSGAGQLDCINLIKKIIRSASGGVKKYTVSGATGLWKSRSASAKYRDVIAYRALSDTENGCVGEILAMIAGETCNHVGLCCGDGTVIHASASHGAVVRMPVHGGGWTHALTHRYIAVGTATTQTENSAYVVCAEGGLRQRKKPNGRYMQMIPDGAQITITEIRSGWGKTVWRGHTGYVSLDYVKREEG